MKRFLATLAVVSLSLGFLIIPPRSFKIAGTALKISPRIIRIDNPIPVPIDPTLKDK